MSRIADIQKYPLKSVFTLSIPIIAFLFLQSFYTVADSYWISGLGENAVIAIGYVLNLWYCLQKLGDGIGRSCNVLMSTSFGADDYENTNNVACHGVAIMIVLSIVLPFVLAIGIYAASILLDLGDYAILIMQYFAIPLIFICFVLFNNFFSAILGSEGETKKAAYIGILGNVVNLVLDPILIYFFNLGMFGAGIATIIGCIVSCTLYYYTFFVKGNVVMQFGREHFHYDGKILKEIISLSIPLILNGFIVMVFGVLINYALNIYSNPAMSFGFVILVRLQSIMLTPISGISQGFSIVAAHLNGAKRYKTIMSTLLKSLAVTMSCAIVIGAIFLCTYDYFISFFSSDLEVIDAVSNVIIFSILSFILQPCVRITVYAFIALEKILFSFLGLILNIGIFVVLLFFSNEIFSMGAVGIFGALVLADLTESIILLYIVKRVLDKKLEEKNQEENEEIPAI